MGYRARWLAVKNVGLADLLAETGLRIESKIDEAVYDPGLYAVNLPGGWLVVMGDGWDWMDSIQPAQARALSKGTEALHFYTDDEPMNASLAAFRDGAKVWSLEHDRSKQERSPVITGSPPPLVATIVADLERQQAAAGDDCELLYDAAPEIAKALVGFRHDQTLADGAVLPIFVLAHDS